MTYDELVAAISSTVETTFETSEIDAFIRQTETLVYQTVQLSVLNKTVQGAFTASNRFLTLPTDFVYPLALAVVNGSNFEFLLPKDMNFIREAYPNPATTGVPKHYSLFDSATILVGPTPASSYTAELQYAYYPESIVDANTTWLGDNFDPILLNGALVQAGRFLKLEEDVIKNYDKLYLQSVALLKNLGDGKLRQDMYRAGQVHTKVS